MRILFDQGTPVPLRRSLLVLTTTSWPRIRQVTERIQTAIALIKSGSYQELLIP
jgi:vancomycin permeability regulator SanA